MDLYHAEIRLPDGFTIPTARVALKWTRHAERARWDDRYGMIPMFSTIPLSQFEVIEVGVEAGIIAKILVRGHYTDEIDICFVLIPGPQYVVKTVWMNRRNDQHKTLDRSKYVQ